MRFRLGLLVLSLLLSSNVFAAEFETLFSKWTEAFNKKEITTTCSLFSKNLTANYQGVPTKNYKIVCDGFKKIFKEPQQYHYRFKIHHVYHENNLATVRITWYLQITDNGKIISQVQDEGIDILQRDANGEWKIVNYLGYPVH